MKPVRVLQFITPSGFYGAERWVLALANNLDADHVVCSLAVSEESESQDLTLLDYWPEQAGSVIRVPMSGRFDWRAIGRLADVIRDQKIDVLHTHGYKSDIIGWLASRKAQIPCVSTPHGFSGNVGMKMRLFIGLGTFLLRYFDAVAPLSRELESDMAKLKVPECRTRLIPNGVDLKEIDQVLDDQASSDIAETDRFTIGFIGQMIPRKGVSELLKAFDQFHETTPQSRLVLVGDGHERPELERFASSLSSRQAIQFTGFREDRLSLLKRFDLFVMTSSLEGIPRCMMEAMAVGTPVAAYDIPGVDLLIENGVTGLSVPHGDNTGLSRLFHEAMENPGAARERAENARELMEDQYSAARMAKEYERLFTELRDYGHLVTPAVKGAMT